MAKENEHVAYSSPLDGFFWPKTIAVIGASEKPGSVGRTLLWNLMKSPFGGIVFPINPKRRSVLGIRSYKNISAIGEKIDLAIVAVRAAEVPPLIEECGHAGVMNVIIMSAFREAAGGGSALEDEVFEIARKHKIRVIGPYSLGVMMPRTGLNATVSSDCAMPGRIGLISQSGTMCSAILDWSYKAHVGFSVVISFGKIRDVDWGDLIYFLGDDPDTKSIILYMESIGNPRSFLSAAREVANNKPIIVIKGGRFEQFGRTAASHTGSLTNTDEVLDAALKRSGVLRVNSIADLFSMAEVLEKQPLPKGRNMAIITNAGGPGLLATDSLIAEGGQLARLSDDTIDKLSEFLPGHWSHGNPIVGLGDDLSDIYGRAIHVVADDPDVHGILAIITPKPTIDPAAVAETIRKVVGDLKKPLLASWMGGTAVAAANDIFTRAGIPCFPFPDTSTRIFNYMWMYRENLNSLYETPHPIEEWEFQQNAWVNQVLVELLGQTAKERRTVLTEVESKKILEAYGIPVVRAFQAASEEEAIERANHIGYPVVIKLLSKTIRQRSEAGVVRLNLMDEDEVRQAFREIGETISARVGSEEFAGVSVQAACNDPGYELILGSRVDPQFGPVLLFGTGGALLRAYDDKAIALPPLNSNLAHKMMAGTKIFKALQEMEKYGQLQLEDLEAVLIRLGQLVIEQPCIKEIDIDPFFAGESGFYALDARVVLFGQDESGQTKPAIRPYPVEYVQKLTPKDNSVVLIRPIKPEDESLMVEFHKGLSEQSVYNRYFGYLHVDSRTDHLRLSRLCFTDYERNMTLVVEKREPEKSIIGVGRLIRKRGSNDAEFAIMIADNSQGIGIGRALLSHILDIGKKEGMDRIIGHILEGNDSMIKICENLGFAIQSPADSNLVEAAYDLRP